MEEKDLTVYLKEPERYKGDNKVNSERYEYEVCLYLPKNYWGLKRITASGTQQSTAHLPATSRDSPQTPRYTV